MDSDIPTFQLIWSILMMLTLALTIILLATSFFLPGRIKYHCRSLLMLVSGIGLVFMMVPEMPGLKDCFDKDIGMERMALHSVQLESALILAKLEKENDLLRYLSLYGYPLSKTSDLLKYTESQLLKDIKDSPDCQGVKIQYALLLACTGRGSELARFAEKDNSEFKKKLLPFFQGRQSEEQNKDAIALIEFNLPVGWSKRAALELIEIPYPERASKDWLTWTKTLHNERESLLASISAGIFYLTISAIGFCMFLANTGNLRAILKTRLQTVSSPWTLRNMLAIFLIALYSNIAVILIMPTIGSMLAIESSNSLNLAVSSAAGLIAALLAVEKLVAAPAKIRLFDCFALRPPSSISIDTSDWTGSRKNGMLLRETISALTIACFALSAITIIKQTMLGYMISDNPVIELFALARDTGELFSSFSIVLGAVIFAPILEEILFRGALYGYLRNKIGIAGAAGLSSLAFGIAHFDLPEIVSLILIGLVLVYVYERTGSLKASIALHSLNNLISVIVWQWLP